MHTGNRDYLRFALAAQERIFSHHMLISGIPSTSEDHQTTTALDVHEPVTSLITLGVGDIY